MSGDLVTVEEAADAIGWEPWKLRDMAVLGGAPQAYGPFPKVDGSRYRIRLDIEDVKAWHAAGRPIADRSYAQPASGGSKRRVG